mgnify:CR=1 FL=1
MVSHGAGSTRQFAKEYMYKPRLDEDTLVGDFIAMAMGSAADLCIVPMRIIWDLEAMHELIRRPHLAGIGNGV